MRRWRRPHVADGGMAATGLMLASGALFGVGLLVHVGLGARVRLDSYVVLSVAMVVVWRLHRIGLYTGDHGVRICRFGRTRVLPWHAIYRFETRPATLLGQPLRQPGLWIIAVGEAIETPVRQHQRWRGWDLAKRELSSGSYHATVRRLEDELARHCPREGPPQTPP